MNVRTYVKPGRDADILYEQNEIGVLSAVRCLPHDGLWLYEVSATYATNTPSNKYYLLAANKSDAKVRFDRWIPYMEITNVRLVPQGDEAEAILADPYKMPL